MKRRNWYNLQTVLRLPLLPLYMNMMTRIISKTLLLTTIPAMMILATSLKEVHQYTYNEKGVPIKMLRIKNDKDTLEVDFILDVNGNVIEEIEKMQHGKHYYYYYDDKKQLTDIVRYNIISKDMKPDLVFEYNSKGQLIQMVAVEEGVNKGYYNEKDVVNYYTWRYFYNDEGLRIIEKCFSRSSKLLGYVEYEYE